MESKEVASAQNGCYIEDIISISNKTEKAFSPQGSDENDESLLRICRESAETPLRLYRDSAETLLKIC